MEGGNNSRPRRITSGLRRAELLLGAAAAESVASNGGIELNETDVVWAGDYEEESTKNKEKEEPPWQTVMGSLAVPLQSSIKENGRRRMRRGIEHGTAGLSAVLDDGNRALGRSSLLGKKPLTAAANFGQSTARIIIPSMGSNSKGSNEEYSVSAHKYHQSAPVNVPHWSKTNHELSKPQGGAIPGLAEGFEAEDDDDDKDEERLPPHEILARDNARSHMTTFSVYEGLGRTLKGRDLRRVRNAVWRKTGFLD